MSKQIAQRIHEKILTYNHLLLVTHQNPDGDAAGSVSALAQALKNLGKQVTILCITPFPSQFHFLPHIHESTSDVSILQHHKEGIIVCDSGDLKYAGVEQYTKSHHKERMINIDHHASNQKYGIENLVMDTASSTTEVLYYFFATSNIHIDSGMATALLTGLITDTTNFSNAGTSRFALKVGSSLIQKGARLEQIQKYILRDKPIMMLKLFGIVLNRLELDQKTNIVHTYVTQTDMQECGIAENEVEGIANLLNHLNEGKASLVLREKQEGNVKVSLRTTYDDMDVSKIAGLFGGGGHRKAAGFTLQVPIQEAWKTICQTLEQNNTKSV